MASERLTQEVKIGDLPRIELGAFNWQPIDKVVTPTAGPPAGGAANAQKPVNLPPNFLPANRLTNREFPLNMLENRTFAGTGYNVVWRPRSLKPLVKDEPEGSERDVLQLNLTAETLAFSGNIGDVPNRGADSQEDLILRGLPYIQRIGAFEDETTGSNSSKEPFGIHFEPGVFMFVPKCEKNPAGHPETINRMASIPHGTTINAQGGINPIQVSGKPDMKDDVLSIFPFVLGAADPVAEERKRFFQKQLNFDSDKDSNRLPKNFTRFSKTITRDIFRDPNQVLRNAIADQNIESFVRLDLTTSSKVNPNPPGKVVTANTGIIGGGTANIGFLQGTDTLTDAGKDKVGNAHAAKMTVTYWIETLSRNLTIQPRTGNEQVFPTAVSAAGVLGPTFFVSKEESDKLSSPVTKKVTWTQIQYSQNVTLNFNGLSWPHISVATLGDISRIPVPDVLGDKIRAVL